MKRFQIYRSAISELLEIGRELGSRAGAMVDSKTVQIVERIPVLTVDAGPTRSDDVIRCAAFSECSGVRVSKTC